MKKFKAITVHDQIQHLLQFPRDAEMYLSEYDMAEYFELLAPRGHLVTIGKGKKRKNVVVL